MESSGLPGAWQYRPPREKTHFEESGNEEKRRGDDDHDDFSPYLIYSHNLGSQWG